MINVVVMAIAYAAVTKTVQFAQETAVYAMSHSSTGITCSRQVMMRAANNHNHDVLGMQIAHTINQTLVKEVGSEYSQLAWRSGSFHLSLLAVPRTKDIDRTAADLLQETGKLYCGPHFYYARTLGAPVVLRIHDLNRRPIREIRLEPHMCTAK